MVHRSLRVEEPPTIEERVRRDIDDPHDQRRAWKGELVLAGAQDHEKQTRVPTSHFSREFPTRTSKPGTAKPRTDAFGFRPSGFFRISGFGIRISSNPRRTTWPSALTQSRIDRKSVV